MKTNKPEGWDRGALGGKGVPPVAGRQAEAVSIASAPGETRGVRLQACVCFDSKIKPTGTKPALKRAFVVMPPPAFCRQLVCSTRPAAPRRRRRRGRRRSLDTDWKSVHAEFCYWNKQEPVDVVEK